MQSVTVGFPKLRGQGPGPAGGGGRAGGRPTHTTPPTTHNVSGVSVVRYQNEGVSVEVSLYLSTAQRFTPECTPERIGDGVCGCWTEGERSLPPAPRGSLHGYG